MPETADPALDTDDTRLIGYARISTDDQKLDLQYDALEAAGVDLEHDLHTDIISGAKSKRPGLESALKRLRKGDVLIVWRLDRLGRDAAELYRLVAEIEGMGAQLKSLSENIDTTTAVGRLIFGIFAVMAEFERNLIRERTRAGLQSAKDRGLVTGRERVLTPEKIIRAEGYLCAGQMTIDAICAEVECSRATLFNYCPGGRQGALSRQAAREADARARVAILPPQAP